MPPTPLVQAVRRRSTGLTGADVIELTSRRMAGYKRQLEPHDPAPAATASQQLSLPSCCSKPMLSRSASYIEAEMGVAGVLNWVTLRRLMRAPAADINKCTLSHALDRLSSDCRATSSEQVQARFTQLKRRLTLADIFRCFLFVNLML
jgi:hypothetical protein